MAVMPEIQRRGIGSKLIRFGLDYLQSSGCPFVIVLGHAEYYPRFGFVKAGTYNIRCQWPDVPEQVFMIRILKQKEFTDKMPSNGSIARYHKIFDMAV